ncbi:MAG TPA: hypothetical protein VLW50_08140 [Streptosporangiaceae bacterium]|nr:hypothetical protein [Streptosporangiaceae bacterium]
MTTSENQPVPFVIGDQEAGFDLVHVIGTLGDRGTYELRRTASAGMSSPAGRASKPGCPARGMPGGRRPGAAPAGAGVAADRRPGGLKGS